MSTVSAAVAGSQISNAKYRLDAAQRQAILAEASVQEMRAVFSLLFGMAAEPLAENAAAPDARNDTADQVEKLLRERLQLLIEAAELQQAAYQRAEVGFDAVASAHLDALSAHLELAKSVEERLKIRRQMLNVAQQLEEARVRLVEAREVGQAELLKAKAIRLRAEIDLLREGSGSRR